MQCLPDLVDTGTIEFRQVGHGPRDAEHAVVPSKRESAALQRPVKGRSGSFGEAQGSLPQPGSRHIRVSSPWSVAPAVGRPLPCGDHACPGVLRARTGARLASRPRHGYACDLEVDVDPIAKRPGQPGRVPPNRHRRADAFTTSDAVIPARTRVHRELVVGVFSCSVFSSSPDRRTVQKVMPPLENIASDLYGSWRRFTTRPQPPLNGSTVGPDWSTRMGIPEGTPFLLSPQFTYDRELNEFFYSADMLTAMPQTREGYTGNLVMFFNFLHLSRGGIDWRHATEEDHRAYLVWRRHDPHGPRVSGSTWNREVSAQNRFFRWQQARGRIGVNPIPQRARRARPGSYRGELGTTAATYSHDARRSKVEWLPAASYRVWRDVGLRGYSHTGLPDPTFRGRWAARNATFADLMVRTGMRLTEQASLLRTEIPFAPERGYARFSLSEAAAKGGSGRWIYVPAQVLRDVAAYVEIDRRSVVEAARRRGRYEHLNGPLLDLRSGRVTTAFSDGLRSVTRVQLLPPAQRRQTMIDTENGLEPAALWLSESGTPIAAQTWKDVFRQANLRCRAHDVALRAHPHLLRHTFAVLTLEQLQRGHIEALASLSIHQRTQYVRVFGDPLDWVRRALGHKSVTTTQVYLHALEELEMETRLALIPSEWDDPRASSARSRES